MWILGQWQSNQWHWCSLLMGVAVWGLIEFSQLWVACFLQLSAEASAHAHTEGSAGENGWLFLLGDHMLGIGNCPPFWICAGTDWLGCVPPKVGRSGLQLFWVYLGYWCTWGISVSRELVNPGIGISSTWGSWSNSQSICTWVFHNDFVMMLRG